VRRRIAKVTGRRARDPGNLASAGPCGSGPVKIRGSRGPGFVRPSLHGWVRTPRLRGGGEHEDAKAHCRKPPPSRAAADRGGANPRDAAKVCVGCSFLRGPFASLCSTLCGASAVRRRIAKVTGRRARDPGNLASAGPCGSGPVKIRGSRGPGFVRRSLHGWVRTPRLRGGGEHEDAKAHCRKPPPSRSAADRGGANPGDAAKVCVDRRPQDGEGYRLS
jgi:hypothetical protein